MEDNHFIDMLYGHVIKLIIRGDILRNRITFLYFETPFIVTVYFISMQNTSYCLNKIIA